MNLGFWRSREPVQLALSFAVGLFAPAWLWVVARFSPDLSLLVERMGTLGFAAVHVAIFAGATALMLRTYPPRSEAPRVERPRRVTTTAPTQPVMPPPPPPPDAAELDDLD